MLWASLGAAWSRLEVEATDASPQPNATREESATERGTAKRTGWAPARELAREMRVASILVWRWVRERSGWAAGRTEDAAVWGQVSLRVRGVGQSRWSEVGGRRSLSRRCLVPQAKDRQNLCTSHAHRHTDTQCWAFSAQTGAPSFCRQDFTARKTCSKFCSRLATRQRV